MTSDSRVVKNIIANFAGKTWASILNLAFVPLFIMFLGIEAFGLMGIFLSLLNLIAVLDLGLSSTLNRELARLAVREGTEEESRDLVRTLEILYWVVGVILSAAVICLAPMIAHKWIQTQHIPPASVQHALIIMGVIIAIQWPSSLYAGGLAGLQKQVLLNGVRIAFGSIQAIGGILVLWLISPTIYAYFIWQLIVNLAQTAVIAYYLWDSLPKSKNRASFRKELLAKNMKFAAGMTGITIVATILTQLDKVILSKMLSLDIFGYYMLAVSVGGMINYLVAPIASATFPQFAQQISFRDDKALSALYHKSCQLTSVIVIPAAITFILFAPDVLNIWLNNTTTVQNTYFVAQLYVIGSALNALMTLPFTLQLAHGWTKLSLYKNIIAVVLLVPLLLFLVKALSAEGAAIVWIILNSGYFLFEVPIMHRFILKGEMKKWYWTDIGIPFGVALCIGALARVLMLNNMSKLHVTVWIAVSGVLSLILTAYATPSTRQWLLNFRSKNEWV